ncbi:MAG: 2-dehydropantoate 2-reductase [Parasphingorhabdus sp.]|jgi:2-dehydropantoate 2-reductase
MRIGIIGAGAMGSVYAGLLADAGNDVVVIDTWQAHIQAINDNGLRVEGASGDRTVSNIAAQSDASELEPCDLVIIATKASAVGPAANTAQQLLHKDSLILTIQNGLGAGDRIRAFIKSDNILLGVAAGFGASMRGPGHAHHNAMELIRIGEMAGGMTDRVQRIAQVWQDAGFNVKAFEDINQLIWEKFICNVTFSGSCTVFDMTIGEVMANPEAWKIARNCGLEAYAAGCAKNIRLDVGDPEQYITDFGNRMPNARPSMLLDHHARRASEIDAINGMVPVVAKQVGTASHYNEVVSAIIRAKEASF